VTLRRRAPVRRQGGAGQLEPLHRQDGAIIRNVSIQLRVSPPVFLSENQPEGELIGTAIGTHSWPVLEGLLGGRPYRPAIGVLSNF